MADDATEAWGFAKERAEVDPEAEDLVAPFSGLGDSGFGGDLQSKAEVSREFVAGARWSSVQGAS